MALRKKRGWHPRRDEDTIRRIDEKLQEALEKMKREDKETITFQVVKESLTVSESVFLAYIRTRVAIRQLKQLKKKMSENRRTE